MKRSDIPDAEIIEAARKFTAREADTPDIALGAKYPTKLILAKMEQLVKHGQLECGVTLRTAWPKGYFAPTTVQA